MAPRQLTAEEMQDFRGAVTDGDIEIDQATAEMVLLTMDAMLAEIERLDGLYREAATYLQGAMERLDAVSEVCRVILDESEPIDEDSSDMKVDSETFDALSDLFPVEQPDVEDLDLKAQDA